MAKFRLDHVHLLSSNPEKTAEFYENVIGAKRTSASSLSGKGSVVELTLGQISIKIMPPRDKTLAPNIPKVGYEHFGIETDDIEEAVSILKAKGVKFVRDIMIPRPGIKNAFFFGPEGVLIELSEASSQNS